VVYTGAESFISSPCLFAVLFISYTDKVTKSDGCCVPLCFHCLSVSKQRRRQFKCKSVY